MAMRQELADIADFLARLPLTETPTLEACRSVLAASEPHVARMIARALNQRLETTPEFNIFTITERAGYEVTTHSAFLANLLDPLGAHGQGNLFLASFLSLLKDRVLHWACPPPDSSWQVRREENRVDIKLIHLAT